MIFFKSFIQVFVNSKNLIGNWKLPADLDSVAGKIEYVDFLVWLIMQSGGLGNRVYKTHVSRI